jgi:hypothetical protein
MLVFAGSCWLVLACVADVVRRLLHWPAFRVVVVVG